MASAAGTITLKIITEDQTEELEALRNELLAARQRAERAEKLVRSLAASKALLRHRIKRALND